MSPRELLRPMPGHRPLSALTFIHELRILLRLALPVVVTQVGLLLTTVVDTMMVSRLGTPVLSGFALGNTFHFAFAMPCLGLLMGIDPLIAQAHGRGDRAGALLARRRGLIIAVLISGPATAALYTTGPVLVAMGQDPQVSAIAHTYNAWKAPAVLGMLWFAVERQYQQGRGIMAPAAWVMLIGNLFNALANWVLIWGHLGLPAMGIAGAGAATGLTFVLLPLLLAGTRRLLRLDAAVDQDAAPPAWSTRGLWQIATLGGPMALHISLEHWAFSGSAFLAGLIGVTAVSGHHITLNMAALSFMLPLGVSIGAATRVGNLIGAGDAAGMRRAVRAALGLAGTIMALSAGLFLLLRRHLAGLYTEDPAVIGLVASTLPVVAAFQVSDGVQVAAAAALRAMGKPRAGAMINLLAYYGIALPLAYVLTFRLDFGLRGLWIALAAGVTFAAVVLTAWAERNARRDLRELRHEVHA